MYDQCLPRTCCRKLNAGVIIFLQYKPEEIAAIVTDFEEPGTLAPTGLYLGGAKYMVIQGEPGVVIRGKKVLIIILISYLFSFILTRLHDHIYHDSPKMLVEFCW